MQKREDQTINFYGLNPKTCNAHHLSHDTYPREIIVYSRNIINVCSLFSHEWQVSLIKFMVGTHHSCERREHAFMVLREYTIIFPYPTEQRNAIFGMTESPTYPLCQQTRISLQSVILTVLMIKNTTYTNPHYTSLCTTIYTQTQIFLPSSLLFIVGVVFLEDSYSQNNGGHEGFFLVGSMFTTLAILPLAIVSSFLVCVCETRGMIMML